MAKQASATAASTELASAGGEQGARKKSGRKTKLTPELQARICMFVTAGAPLPDACEAAGISWNTVKDWLKYAKQEKQPYLGFAEAVKQAKAAWRTGCVMNITRASKKDWKAAAWLLERRDPQRWRLPSQHVEAQVNVTQSPELRAALEKVRARRTERGE